jgi:hypothetical protein
MAHWSKDINRLYEMEDEYNQALAEYRQLKADGKREEAYAFREQTLDLLGEDFEKARDYWRQVGEAVDESHEGKRTGVKTVDFVDDNGNGIDDREENQ